VSLPKALGQSRASLSIVIRDLLASGFANLFATTFLAGLGSRLLLLVMAVVLARQLSPAGYGAFTFATGGAALAAQFAGLGWPTLMSRLMPALRIDENWSALRGLLLWGDRVVLVGSLSSLCVIGAFIFLPGVSSEIRTGLILASLLVVPVSINLMRRNQLASARQPALGILLDEALPPALVIALVMAFAVANVTVAVSILSVATVVSALLATIALRRSVPEYTWKVKPDGAPRAWMMMALPLLVGLSSKLIMDRMDILMLGPLGGLEQTGYYGASFRITYLLTFPQAILMSIMAPLLSESFAEGRFGVMWRNFSLMMIFAFVTAVPACIILLTFNEPIMSLVFGHEYVSGGRTLQVLALVQTLTALSIPCGGLMIASGRGKSFGAISLLGLVLNAALNLMFIPWWGAAGAAFATLAASGLILLGQIFILLGLRKYTFVRTSNV